MAGRINKMVIEKHFTVEVRENVPIAANTYLMTMECPDGLSKFFRAGQFMHIEIPGSGELLMRRPISINWVDAQKKEILIAYSVMGKGTARLTGVLPGQELDILAPLGNGFMVKPDMKKIWLVGGGIGCAPLRSLYAKFPDREYKAFLGFRSAECVYQEAEFSAFADVHISTDDGSCGFNGFCTQLLQRELEKDRPDVILSCGPAPFFKALSKVIGDVPTQVSLEQRMGCGTGGCATCSCGINGEYKRICVQGPVFDIKEVDAIWT